MHYSRSLSCNLMIYGHTYAQVSFQSGSKPSNITSSTLFKTWRRRPVFGRKFSNFKINEGISAFGPVMPDIVVGITEAGHQNIHAHILEGDIAMSDVVLVEKGESLANFQ